MNERCGLGRGHFPIALFVDASAEIPLLRPLLDNKRRPALRARLGNRLVVESSSKRSIPHPIYLAWLIHLRARIEDR